MQHSETYLASFEVALQPGRLAKALEHWRDRAFRLLKHRFGGEDVERPCEHRERGQHIAFRLAEQCPRPREQRVHTRVAGGCRSELTAKQCPVRFEAPGQRFWVEHTQPWSNQLEGQGETVHQRGERIEGRIWSHRGAPLFGHPPQQRGRRLGREGFHSEVLRMSDGKCDPAGDHERGGGGSGCPSVEE